APGALEARARAVAVVQRAAQVAVQPGLGPGHGEVAVGGVVHEVDDPGAGGPRGDLAEHRLAGGGAVPLHVREAGAEPERGEHPDTHLSPRLEVGYVEVAQGDRDRADPLVEL